MSILNIFKNLKTKKTGKEEKAGKEIPAEEKKVPVEAAAKKAKTALPAAREKKPAKGIAVPGVLLSLAVTEKAGFLSKTNHYVFRVSGRSNKIQIKKAVEGFYGVDVLSVNIINIHKKKRRSKKGIGWKKGYKKAVVRIKAGQKIEALER